MNDHLKYFIGKLCTVITRDVNYKFKFEQMNDYFVGIIEDIDENGILMSHFITKCKNYVFLPHVISITEEQVLPGNDPIVEKYRKEKPITAAKNILTTEPQTPNLSQFINPTAMAEVAKKMKESIKPTS